MALYQAAKGEVAALVEKFHAERDRFRDPNYNETQVRVEFINPLFGALGWEVANSLHVVHEDRAIVDDGQRKRVKHPDYGFRTGRDIRFYVEAKKPSVRLQDDPDPAYQVRRYGWSKKLPVSALTDFEEFSVYNCLQRPTASDGPHVARLRYLTYEQYLDQWDEMYGLFSYEAVLDGALERFVEAEKPRGTLTVDDAFLREMEGWRGLLAKDIAERNRGLTHRQLNIAVQRTIDRLVFLRICEDRNIEPYGRLNNLAQDRADVYGELKSLYASANDKYNSGLFHFSEDDGDEAGDPVSLRIDIGDEALQTIVGGLYYPQSPYEFSVMPADVLGQVYERFLGSVIVLENGSAAIEEKPEVRKAGGVYYTPTYIVDYIVAHTVGALLDGKNPNQVAELRILDPACGSGSFLIGAYQYVLDWHLAYYAGAVADNANSSYKSRLRPSDDPARPWALTTAEKKRILLNNLYGVDLDQQAVEVTKLSLLLKMLEEETAATATQYALFGTDDRLLPDLGDNIKWGNSLIGSDFYAGKQLPMFDDEEIYRVKAFDWDVEFAGIMSAGGFDAVIGNPPYVRQEGLKDFKEYFEKTYQSAHRGADLYVYFMEKGTKLLRPGGLYGIIVSSSFLRTTYAMPLRRVLNETCVVLSFVDFGGLPVFASAKDTYVCIPILSNAGESDSIKVSRVTSLRNLDLSDFVKSNFYEIPASRLNPQVWSIDSEAKIATFEKIKQNSIPLGSYVNDQFYRGVTTGFNSAFVIDSDTREKLIFEHASSKEIIKPFVGGSEIRRYFIRSEGKYIIFSRRGIDISRYPAVFRYLSNFKEELMPRPKDWKGKWNGRKPGRYEWYEIQDSTDYFEEFERAKIVYPDIAKNPRFSLDTEATYVANTGYIIASDDLYLLGILNSRLAWFAVGSISIPFGIRAGEYRYRMVAQYMKQVPIRTIDFDNPAEAAQHDRMVTLVETMLDLHRQLPAASGAQKRLVEGQIARTDREIDALVYELYGLTDDEIAIVEQ